MKKKKHLSPLEKQKARIYTMNLVKRNYMLYIFLIPALTYIVMFNYVPLYGIQIAFRDYNTFDGIWGSEWVGMENFVDFFTSRRCGQIIWNTLSLSLYSLVVGFPAPILLALLLNCVRTQWFKRFCQTATYLPHFISIVVLVGMMDGFLSERSGFITTLLEPFFGGRVHFRGIEEYFQTIYVLSGVWQGCGWGSIIYIAALSGVSPEWHEAAIIDGASRLKRIWYIDVPVIIPTMVILLILQCGSLLNVGFEKVYLMTNPLVSNKAEIISTYVYKKGLVDQDYGYATAVGLFNNVINFIILISVNKFANKISGSGLW